MWPVWNIWDKCFFFTANEALCCSESHREFSCFNLEKKDGFIWSQWRQITHHSISDGKKALLLHFHFHLLLICIYSYIITNGGPLGACQIPPLYKKQLNWQGWMVLKQFNVKLGPGILPFANEFGIAFWHDMVVDMTWYVGHAG